MIAEPREKHVPDRTRVTIIDPLTDPRWNAFATSHPESMVFHRAEWARVLIESYQYEPRYHVIETEASEIQAAWPAMLIASKLTGRRLVTMPFSDHCGPLVRDEHEASVLMESVQADAGELGAGRIEVRGWPDVITAPESLVRVQGYVRHVIDLSPGRDAVYSRLTVNLRRSLKRAEKHGVTTRLAESRADLDPFCDLNLKLRRQHGMLPQPRRFFEATYRHLIEPGLGYILFAERTQPYQPLAAILCLRHNDITLCKYAVNDGDLREYRGSHSVMWKAIEMEIARGAKWYDMGRSDASAQSLHWFKEQWGAVAIDAPYYYHPKPGGLSTEDPKGAKKAAMEIFARFAPPTVYRAAGNLAYRHLG
jgi:Acetyltransferase (GNAT) domain